MKTVKNIFKSLINNQAAIDNRKMKWWVSLILLILYTFLPWIPSLSSGYTTDGSAIFKTAGNYEVSTALKEIFTKEYFKDNVVIQEENGNYSLGMDFEAMITTIDEQGNEVLTPKYYGVRSQAGAPTDYSWENEFNGTSDKELLKGTYNDLKDANNYVTEKIDLKVPEEDYTYYFDCVSTDVLVEETSKDSAGNETTTSSYKRRQLLEVYYFPALSRHLEGIDQYIYNFANMVIFNRDAAGTLHNDPRSFIVFLSDYVQMYIYNFDTKASDTSISAVGSYLGNLDEGLKGREIQNGTKLVDYVTENGAVSIQDGFQNNFCSILNSASRPYTINSTWMNILFITCVTLGSILIASIILIIMFKRKASIYRDSNYFHALNTAINLTSTASILGMAFGFFDSNGMMALMMIVAGVLVRIVFISNKITPPAQSANNSKPIYQARD